MTAKLKVHQVLLLDSSVKRAERKIAKMPRPFTRYNAERVERMQSLIDNRVVLIQELLAEIRKTRPYFTKENAGEN